MKKKSILTTMVIILAIIIVFMASIHADDYENQITLGNTIFTLPEGFHQGISDETGDINITNGYDTIFLKEYDKNNTKEIIKEYVALKKDQNHTIHINNFTVNNFVVYKSTIDDEPHIIHYWFDNNGKTYTVYSQEASRNTDNIVKDLISSLN